MERNTPYTPQTRAMKRAKKSLARGSVFQAMKTAVTMTMPVRRTMGAAMPSMARWKVTPRPGSQWYFSVSNW